MPPVSRMSSSTYWIPPSRSHSLINSMKDSGAGSMSSSGDSTMPRHYIDPWDLENYAYLKRHCSDLMMDSDPIISLGTNGLDSAYSDFYYVPSHEAELLDMNAKQSKTQKSNHRQAARRQSMIIPEESNALMAAAGIEEEDFYNEKYEVSQPQVCCRHHNKTFRRHSAMVPYVEYEDHHPVRYVPFSHNNVYGEGRPMKGQCCAAVHECLPPPPPEGHGRVCTRDTHHLVYVYQTPRLARKNNREYRQPIACSDDCSHGSDMRSSSEDSNLLYDELVSNMALFSQRRRKIKPQHFGLSTFGHLKIDYSCNWNNLDRYIGHS